MAHGARETAAYRGHERGGFSGFHPGRSRIHCACRFPPSRPWLERNCLEYRLSFSVSAIVSVYNRFELTKRTVASVLAQTAPVSEVILVDDGSFDGTSELLQQYIAGEPVWREKVRYVHQENQGQAAARNCGIREAKSDWVAFVDNDDLWLPQKLEWQFRALERFADRSGVCFTDAWFMNNPQMKMTLFQLAGRRHDDEIGIVEDPVQYLLDKRKAGRALPTWVQTVLVNAELVRSIGGFDPALHYGEDYDLVFRLALKTMFTFVSMPMVLIDRQPVEQRHTGESAKWDTAEFRLEMTQKRLEKRLRMTQLASRELQLSTRIELSAVHSERANWFLQIGQYHEARKAAVAAVRIYSCHRTVIKWLLVQSSPRIARLLLSTGQTPYRGT